MIVRLLLAVFGSLVAGVCYSAGLYRLMSALLLCFGAVGGIFFGVVFLLPADDPRVTFSVATTGASWPFFAVAVGLFLAAGALMLARGIRPAVREKLQRHHWQQLGFGLLLYFISLVVPVLFWFPSEQMKRSADVDTIAGLMVTGVLIFLVGSAASLWLLYRASRGTTDDRPDFMRRLVLILFSVAHLDKLPFLVAYLLVYSEEPALVFPKVAALALAGYFPIGVLLARISLEAGAAS